jgi:CBS domain-containing protein
MNCPCCNARVIPGDPWCPDCWTPLANEGSAIPQDRVEWSLLRDTVTKLGPNKAPIYPRATPVGFVLEGMEQAKSTSAILITDDGLIDGLLTEHDVLDRIAPLGPSGLELPVYRFMTKNPQTINENESLARVVQIMDGTGYRHLPVVRAGRPVGMITVSVLMRHFRELCTDALG